MDPALTGGTYVNFLPAEGRTACAPPTAPTRTTACAALKREYDPTNLFRLNQNVPPD